MVKILWHPVHHGHSACIASRRKPAAIESFETTKGTGVSPWGSPLVLIKKNWTLDSFDPYHEISNIAFCYGMLVIQYPKPTFFTKFAKAGTAGSLLENQGDEKPRSRHPSGEKTLVAGRWTPAKMSSYRMFTSKIWCKIARFWPIPTVIGCRVFLVSSDVFPKTSFYCS